MKNGSRRRKPFEDGQPQFKVSPLLSLAMIAIIALFCGFGAATNGTAFFLPFVDDFVMRLVCGGKMQFVRGVFDFAVCVAPDGTARGGITLFYLPTATVIYAAVYFVLISLGWAFVRMVKRQK